MPTLVKAGLSRGEFEMEKRHGSQYSSSSSLATTFSTQTFPCHLKFESINYSIFTRKPGTPEAKSYDILNGISGELEPGSLTAIMGPTGSGKTSLLNALANRMPVVKGGNLRGQLLVNGSSICEAHGASRFARLSSYVMQDDALNPFLTIRETLGLAASFQLPAATTLKERGAIVAAVAAELGLSKVIDSLIGSVEVRGVSGGERKRANIGVELIKNPSILFLDEPTSGLDSFQAQSVMECLSGLASRGRTVAASIHQPRSSIFGMFQQLLLVSEGRCIYFGSAERAVDYFAEIDSAFACPALFNPADWFLDITSPDYRTPQLEKESLERVKRLDATWVEKQTETMALSTANAAADVELALAADTGGTKAGHQEEQFKLLDFQSSWFRQFRWAPYCFAVARNSPLRS